MIKVQCEIKESVAIPTLRAYPLVFVSVNRSVSNSDLNFNQPQHRNESFFFVEFKLFNSDAIVYVGVSEQGNFELAPSISQFKKGLNYKDEELRNFTMFRAPVESHYRFIYERLTRGKSYQFLIAQGDEYPDPHQAISKVQVKQKKKNKYCG